MGSRRETEVLASFMGWGYMDVETGLEVVEEVGLSVGEIGERMSEFAEECGMQLSEMDFVAFVYEEILQEARGEIDDLIGYDFINDDGNKGEIYVAGNYMATSYDYRNSAHEYIALKLAQWQKEEGSEDVVEEFSEATKWFLSKIGIDQKDVDDSEKSL